MPVVERSDLELVEALRRREDGAFEEVYARYGPRIWAFLVRLARGRGGAEDLFQETWLAAARHAHRLEGGSNLGRWLYTIARNKHRSALRFRLFDRRRRARAALESPVAPVLPDDEVVARLRAAALGRAFAALPAKHREVLLLCLSEGQSTKEVGAILGLGEGAVRKRLSRARRALAERLAEEEAGR